MRNAFALSRRTSLLMLAGLPLMTHAQKQTVPPTPIAAELPGAHLQGGGKLTFLGMRIYDAQLWVRDGFSADNYESRPIAIDLVYARTLYGKLIAERSLAEMKKIAEVPDDKGERWLAEMTKLFPDVAKGDRITGVYRPGESMRFFFNGKLQGEIRDADFARWFVGIWLSPKTSEPQLLRSLLGLS
jgi:hypothetical protein